MYVVTLEFSSNRANAPDFLAGHNAWIAQGFADGVFLLTGGLKPNAGGVVLAHNVSRAELEARVQDDPFVAADVVRPSILEIAPGRTVERLAFLKG